VVSRYLRAQDSCCRKGTSQGVNEADCGESLRLNQEGRVGDREDEIEIIKGAPDAIKKIARIHPIKLRHLVDSISSQGDTPLAVTRNREIIGIIRLKDVLKPGIREKILSVKVMGIRPVMLTGDQPSRRRALPAKLGSMSIGPSEAGRQV